ncbi:MAG: caspase family protein [SAR324 cluster bacterium]|nr:caspase family protein [SAR324 cluster bacterium]
MKRLLLVFTVLLLSVAPLMGQSTKGVSRTKVEAPGGGKRVALVVGNSDYSSEVGPLRNPVNDARTMARALREVGFEVTHLENAKLAEFREAVWDFGQRLRESEAALFYFSGHGVQYNGSNYLLPLGMRLKTPRHIQLQAVSENEVLAEMEGGTKNRVNLVIVDACRNNLATRGFRSASKGLAQPEFHPSGSLIAYATAPGKVASDGAGANSPYVAELSKHLRTPGLRVEDVFKRVLVGVEARTKGKQIPWVNASLKGDFYFVLPPPEPEPAVTTPAPATTSVSTPQPASSSATRQFLPDEELWKDVKDSDDPEDFKDFLAVFPDSKLAPVARIKLKRLKRKQAKAGQPQQPTSSQSARVQQPQQTTLQVDANVWGAVHLDGTYKGDTGEAFKVDAGTHHVRVTRVGYESYSKPVKLRAGENRFLRVHLKKSAPKKTTLRVVSNLMGHVLLDERPLGLTGRTHQVKPGTYRVRVTREGYQPFLTTMALIVGQTKNLYVSFTKKVLATQVELRQAYDDVMRRGPPSASALSGFLQRFRDHPQATFYLNRVEKRLEALQAAKTDTAASRASGSGSGYSKRQAYLDFLEAKSSNSAAALRRFLRKHSGTPGAKGYLQRARRQLRRLE